MAKLISEFTKNRIKQLRQMGHSLPEIAAMLKIAKATVFRYIQGVEILEEYKEEWHRKRGGSIKRKRLKEKEAEIFASQTIPKLNKKDLLVFISALYWGEGSKGDFNIVNSDPKLIKSIMVGLIEIFSIPINRFKVSLRIYEDMDPKRCIDYWAGAIGYPASQFSNTNVIFGKKRGKLPYGMCRLRVLRGGDMLKYLKAAYARIFTLLDSSHSSSG